MTPPHTYTGEHEPTPTRGDVVRMSRDSERDLVNFIAGTRPYDWSKIAVRAAIRRTVMEYGSRFSAVQIGQAALHAAGNPLNDTPDSIWRPGPHWDNLPEYLNKGADGRRYHSQHDRELIEDARASQARRDPDASRRGYEAARAELDAIRATRGA